MNNPWARLDEHTKLKIIKWSYLVIVVAATVTLAILVHQNQNLVNNVQNDRKQLIYDNCLEQNSRHEQLIQFVTEENFKDAIKKAEEANEPIPTEAPPIDPVAKKFIDLLAEEKNCNQLVKNIFGSNANESS